LLQKLAAVLLTAVLLTALLLLLLLLWLHSGPPNSDRGAGPRNATGHRRSHNGAKR
jgi:hypothetical protein